MVTPEVVQMLQDNGPAVFVSTVDDPEDMARMKRLGVDGIISNFPERI
jgi:glycerophosphoryl diester phosphodiesterase